MLLLALGVWITLLVIVVLRYEGLNADDLARIIGEVAKVQVQLAIMEGKLMAIADDILAKVQAEGTVIGAIKALVLELKANQGDPVKLQAIVAAIDANDLALAAITTPEGGPAPTE